MNYMNTRIYRRSLELVTTSQHIIKSLPRGCGFLADQLRRASSSVVLNFAEGCGKSSTLERRRYFQTARASAYEVAAAIDIAHGFGAITVTERDNANDICDHIAAMLYKFSAVTPR